MLQSEVSSFLAAMSRGDETERRRYERVLVSGQTALVAVGRKAAAAAAIIDISRGGISVEHDADEPKGTDATVDLPGSGTVQGRIARVTAGSIGITFRQDEATLALIDRALDHMAGCGSVVVHPMLERAA